MSFLPEYRALFRGWVCYDAECSFCSLLAARSQLSLEQKGFKLIPLQTPWLKEKFGLNEPFKEMVFISPAGRYWAGLMRLQKFRSISGGAPPWEFWLTVRVFI